MIVAAVSVEDIAVIALFGAVEDGVTAAGQRAIGAATGCGGVGVCKAVVALLAGVERAVAAVEREELAGERVASVALRCIVQRRFACFAESTLEDAVAA